MRKRPHSITLVIISTLLVVLQSDLSARVGESRRDLEKRLLRQSDKGLEVTDDDLESFYRSRSPVFSQLRILEDSDIEYIIYYKSSGDLIPNSNRLWQEGRDGRRIDKPVAKPEGWMLHVAYFNGVSVLELYQRSQNMTDVEKEGVLLINAERSEWKKGAVPKGQEGTIVPQVFPANHYRKDLAVYANVTGDSIVLFDPRLDQRIHKMNIEKAEEEGPDSLDGF